MLKKNDQQCRILYPLKISFKNKSIIKTFPTIKNENMASRLLGKY